VVSIDSSYFRELALNWRLDLQQRTTTASSSGRCEAWWRLKPAAF
jgi:hypothetical protein